MKIKVIFLTIQNGFILGACAFILGCAATAPSQPAPISLQERGDVLAITAINDLHGALFTERNSAPHLPGAGLETLSGFLEILSQQHGSQFLLFDLGNSWIGKFEGELDDGETLAELYSALDVKASTLGLHEILALPERLARSFKNRTHPLLLSNVEPSPHPLVKSDTILQLPDGTKIGLIALTTPTIESQPDQPKSLGNQNFKFRSLVSVITEKTQKFKRQGVHIVGLLANVEVQCSKNPSVRIQPQVFTAKDAPCTRGRSDESELVKTIQALPAEVRSQLDFILSGQGHQAIHHFISGIPVIQNSFYARSLSVIYLYKNRSLKKAARIEGPIPVCEKIFEQSGTCYVAASEKVQDLGAIQQNTFRGKAIAPPTRVSQILDQHLDRLNQAKAETIGFAATSIEPNKLGESAIGNLLADALRSETGAQFAFVNPGITRSGISSGPITVDSLYKSIPFDSSVSLMRLTGSELKTLLRITQSGTRGFYSYSGINTRIIPFEYQAPANDLDGDKKVSAWEVNRIIDLKHEDGTRIQMAKTYQVATIDYLARGGDDLSWFINQIPPERVHLSTGTSVRDALRRYLTSQGPLNTSTKPLVDPQKPRITFSAPRSRR